MKLIFLVGDPKFDGMRLVHDDDDHDDQLVASLKDEIERTKEILLTFCRNAEFVFKKKCC